MNTPTQFAFDFEAHEHPRAAAADPTPSHLAAHQATATGLAARQAAAVLELVKRYPNSTSAELAARSDLGPTARHIVARRLPELARAGFITRGPARECTTNHTKATTWTPRNA
jgi:hypothetical protein